MTVQLVNLINLWLIKFQVTEITSFQVSVLLKKNLSLYKSSELVEARKLNFFFNNTET